MSSRDQGTDRRLSVAALQAGMRRHQAGALAQAEAHYREAIAHDPGNADALHYLGVACSQQGRHDEAIALILSRFDGCWRWLLEREDSPWYPTARLFRQPAAGEWDSVIARVAQALSDWSHDARRPVVDAMVAPHSSSTDCRLPSPAATQKKSPPGGR